MVLQGICAAAAYRARNASETHSQLGAGCKVPNAALSRTGRLRGPIDGCEKLTSRINAPLWINKLNRSYLATVMQGSKSLWLRNGFKTIPARPGKPGLENSPRRLIFDTCLRPIPRTMRSDALWRSCRKTEKLFLIAKRPRHAPGRNNGDRVAARQSLNSQAAAPLLQKSRQAQTWAEKIKWKIPRNRLTAYFSSYNSVTATTECAVEHFD